MLVWLKQNWFAPDGRHYAKCAKNDPTPIPDALREFLPTSFVIISDEEAAASREAEPEKPVDTLRDMDELRAGAQRQDDMVAKAEAFRAQVEAERRKPRKV